MQKIVNKKQIKLNQYGIKIKHLQLFRIDKTRKRGETVKERIEDKEALK